MLLECMGDGGTYSVKELREKTRQPEAWLKQCLNDLATVHTQGPDRGRYQLTEENCRQPI